MLGRDFIAHCDQSSLCGILSPEVIRVGILVLVVLAVLSVLIYEYRLSDRAFREAYEEAMEKDMAYARKHPDCTLEEAHQHRRRVRRLYGRP